MNNILLTLTLVPLYFPHPTFTASSFIISMSPPTIHQRKKHSRFLKGVSGFGFGSGLGAGLDSRLGVGAGDVTRQKSRRVFLSDFFSVYLFNYFSSLNT